MAVDGTVFDLPDTEANARVFGYPGTRPGTKAAFPKARKRVSSRSSYPLDVRCSAVSLSDGRAGASQKIAALSR